MVCYLLSKKKNEGEIKIYISAYQKEDKPNTNENGYPYNEQE